MYKNYSEYRNHDIHPDINVTSSKSMYVLTFKMCIFVTGVKLWHTLDNSLVNVKMFTISKSVLQID